MIDYVICDTETEPFAETDRIRTAYPCPRPVLIGFLEPSGQKHLLSWQEVSAIKAFVANHPETTWVFHNAKFDLSVLYKHLSIAIPPNRVLDTRVLYRLAYPLKDRFTDLASVHEHLFPNLPRLEKGGVRTSFSQDTPVTEEQRNYLSQDLSATERIFQALLLHCNGHLAHYPNSKRVTARRLQAIDRAEYLYSEATAWLARRLESRGLAVDVQALQRHKTELDAQYLDLNRKLLEAGLVKIRRRPGAVIEDLPPDEFKPDWIGRTWHGAVSTKPICLRQLRGRMQRVDGEFQLDVKALRRFFSSEAARLRITEPPVSTKTRQLSLGEDFWKEYRSVLFQPAQDYLALVRCKKYLSAFLTPLIESQATYVYPQYWIPGCETGRWATSLPCIHQVPRALRDIYIPDPGHKFYTCDYKCLELYTLAQSMLCLGIDGNLRKRLNEGGDIHRTTAGLMFNKSPEMVTDDERQSAKACNFGLPGGMGARNFQLYLHGLGVKKTLAETTALIVRWFDTYPDIRQFLNLFEVNGLQFKPQHQSTREFLEDLGFDIDNEGFPCNYKIIQKINRGAIYEITLPSGRCIPQRIYSAAANGFFQGPGADIITRAFIYVCRAGLQPVAVVHDSITVTAYKDIGPKLKTCMLRALSDYCPDLHPPDLTVKEQNHL